MRIPAREFASCLEAQNHSKVAVLSVCFVCLNRIGHMASEALNVKLCSNVQQHWLVQVSYCSTGSFCTCLEDSLSCHSIISTHRARVELSQRRDLILQAYTWLIRCWWFAEFISARAQGVHLVHIDEIRNFELPMDGMPRALVPKPCTFWHSTTSSGF